MTNGVARGSMTPGRSPVDAERRRDRDEHDGGDDDGTEREQPADDR